MTLINGEYVTLGFDVSKSSPSVTSMVWNFTNSKLTIDSVSHKTFHVPPKNALYTKEINVYVGSLLKEIERYVIPILRDDLFVSVAIESPIYHHQSSELQWFLYQNVLSVFQKLNIDVVGYTPNKIKQFIKTFYKNKCKGMIDKCEIGKIYREVFNSSFSFDHPENHDQRDSFFVCVFGSIVQSFPIKYAHEILSIKEIISNNRCIQSYFEENRSDIISVWGPCLPFARDTENKNIYQVLSVDNLLDFSRTDFYPFGIQNKIYQGIKKLRGNDRKNTVKKLYIRLYPELPISKLYVGQLKNGEFMFFPK